MRKKTQKCKSCKHRNEDCYIVDGFDCIRYLSSDIDDNNLIEVDGIVELPKGIALEQFSQILSNWIDSLGWSFTGTMHQTENKE